MNNQYTSNSIIVEKLEKAKSQISLTGDDLEHYIDGIDTAIEIVKQYSLPIEEEYEKEYEKD